MDDVLVGQSDRVYSNLSSANIRIGGLFKGEQTGAFVGDIDDIRIYNDSISGNPGDVSNIPEPSTFIIWSGLAAAGAGYLASRRKSRVTK
jgi:hypothetical protein